MGLYAIDCPQCKKPYMWFSGNMDQRCDNCRNPKEFWLLDNKAYSCQQHDDVGFGEAYPNQIHVIEKSAFDFQVKQLSQVVESSNQIIKALNKQMEDLANQLMIERTETSRFQALVKRFRK